MISQLIAVTLAGASSLLALLAALLPFGRAASFFVETCWIVSLVWFAWQVRGVLINVALSPVRWGMAVLWRRLSLDIDDLE